MDDEELAGRLKKLSADDRELLTQIVMDGLTKAEVARLRGVTRQSINDKIQRIKKFLKKVQSGSLHLPVFSAYMVRASFQGALPRQTR